MGISNMGLNYSVQDVASLQLMLLHYENTRHVV